MVGCFARFAVRNFSVCAALGFGAQFAFAADWFAKDNLQPGHDPSMIRFEDGYALMTTNNQLTLWTSEDAYTWNSHGKTMNGVPSWVRQYAPGLEDVWAPDIVYMNGEYRVYYCGSEFGKRNSAIGLTASRSIMPGTDGYGWTDKGHVVHTKEGVDKYNAIDADVVRTVDGEYWMAFGSFGLGIQLLKLNGETGFQADDDKTTYNIARRTSSASKGAEEGPSLIVHDGKYFLFTAWDICCNQGDNIEQTTYKTAYGRADKVTGPYYDRDGKEMLTGGGTILLERYGRYVGPGGGEAFQDLNRVRFVHHYYDNAGDKFNHIHIRDVVFTDDNWVEMGQPFLGRYLSAEAEHGVLTRAVSGDLVVTRGEKASGNEYLGYINTEGSRIHLPMNIMQAGDYILRYRYANGGEGVATHRISVNGMDQEVKLPATGGWGTFPETSVAMIPATLKRGGNFIDVSPVPDGANFAELDRIDFLRVIRDTIPGNGFDNGIRVRLNEDDLLAMKDGGYAIFENVVADSIKGANVHVMVKGSAGKLSLHTESVSGTVVSECDLSKGSAAENGWNDVECSSLGGSERLSGVQDFYLAASGISGEVVVGNFLFKDDAAPESSSDDVGSSSSSSGDELSSSSCDVLDGCGDSDIKNCEESGCDGCEESGEENCGSSIGLSSAKVAASRFSVFHKGGVFVVRLNDVGAKNVYLLNPLGQVVGFREVRNATAGSEVRFENIPKGRYVVRAGR